MPTHTHAKMWESNENMWVDSISLLWPITSLCSYLIPIIWVLYQKCIMQHPYWFQNIFLYWLLSVKHSSSLTISLFVSQSTIIKFFYWVLHLAFSLNAWFSVRRCMDSFLQLCTKGINLWFKGTMVVNHLNVFW